MTDARSTMTNAETLLERLRRLDVRLWLEGEKLRVSAPAGVLTQDLRDDMLANRDELRRLLGALEVASAGGAATADPSRAPLSFAQERLWFFQELEPNSVAYNIGMALELSGPLDTSLLERSISALVERHATLRTTIDQVDGVPVQHVHASTPWTLNVVDRSATPADERDVTAAQILKTDAERPFRLNSDYPLRVVLVRFAPDEHRLLVNAHHIAADGSSLVLFVVELFENYRALIAGAAPNAAPPAIGYAELARRQRDWLASSSAAESLAFWRDALGGDQPALDFPTDFPRPAVQSFRGAVHYRTLAVDTSEQVRALSRRHGATPFMTLLAAFNALLYRYSGDEKISVGSPVAGRDRTEMRELIGMLVNTIVVRADVSGNPTFDTLIGRVRQSARSALAHQEYPFGRLVDTLQPERDTSRTPFFQVMFNMFPMDAPESLKIGDLTVRAPSMDTLLDAFDGESKFDLTLYAHEKSNGIELLLIYNADLFAADRMERFLAQYERLLNAFLVDPAQHIGDVPLFATAGADVAKLPRAAHPMRQGAFAALTDAFTESTIVERFAQIAAKHADRPAVISGTTRWTYRDLSARVTNLAGAVSQALDGKPARVALLCDHGAPMIAALFGVLTAASVYVPLDPTAPEERLAGLLDDADVTALLVDPQHAELASRIARSRVVIRTDAESSGAAIAPAPAPDSAAYILYTSGSTGKPKGVLQSHRSVLHYVRTYANALELTVDDRVMLLASYTFDAAVVDVFSAILNGAAIIPVALKAVGLDGVARAIHENTITIYHSTPTVFRALDEALSSSAVASVRCFVMGGEKVQPHDVAAFRTHFAAPCVFVDLYGASEASIATMALYARDEIPTGSVVSIGMPVEATTVVLLDEAGNVDPVRGEIAVESPYLALGYWNAPELTANVFSSPNAGSSVRRYRTGDVARRGPDGMLEHLGRRDEQIKIRGVRVEPGEIEAALRAHPGVAQCVVIADASLAKDPMLVGFVVVNPAVPVTTPELLEYLATRLPEYMVPTAIAVLDALPLTRTGKVDRRALPSASALGLTSERDFIAPRDGIEQLIADVWREVLGVERIGVHDNFFALGGHSLNATQVLARLREVARADLPLRALFTSATVEGLANAVRERTTESTADEPILGPRPRNGDLPLSFSQERMWFLQALMPEGTAYNIIIGAQLQGNFDRDAFVASLHDVAMHQESLRTTFPSPEGIPVARVSPTADLSIVERDFRDLPVGERAGAARALATHLATRTFDLERGPLWQTLIMRVADDEYMIVFSVHHIIGDLWSFGVLSKELAHGYNARTRHLPLQLPPVELQYGDFAIWQREWLEGQRLRDQLAYWTSHLRGLVPLEMPTDRPRPAFQTLNGDRRGFELPAALGARIRALSVRENVTPFMTCFAAFNALLHRYSGHEDIAIGVPIANRTRVGTEQLIGTFVNTLVHRNDLSNNPTFRELLKRVRGVALDAFSHQDLPFERLVRELAPERDPSRTPVFQVMFNMANTPTGPAAFNDLAFQPMDVDRPAAQFDLSLLMGIAETPWVVMSYNTDLYDAATIDRMMANYVILLDAATREPDRPIDALPVMADDARRQLIGDANATTSDYPAEPVTELIAQQAARVPNAIAIESGNTKVTYAELEARSNRLARHLAARGVKPGDIVGVCTNRSAEMVVALLAVMKAGAAYVPIDPTYPPSRVQFMLKDSAASAVITESSLVRKLPKSDAAVIAIDGDAAAIAQESADAPAHVPAPSDRAYIIFTSGSTGEPKGVQLPHGALVNFLTSMRREPGLTDADTLLAITTISFDIAGLELYLPLICGATIVLADRQTASDGRRLRELLTKRKPTVMQATPATWRALIDAGWNAGDTPDLKILCGGEAFPRDLADELLTRGAEVWNLYGPTETTIWSTAYHVAPGTGPVPIGTPIANTHVYVLDPRRELTPIGVPGELYIGGDGVAIGYLNRPELTAERFVADPFVGGGARLYRTGDRARFREDGLLEHLGRLDSQVKLRGYRIELGEIETQLAAHPALGRVVVDVRQDRLVAYVVFASGQDELTASELRAFLRDTLPDFMVPSLVVPLAELPLTPNGKVDRRALPDPLRAAGRSQKVFVAPATPAEQAIATIWREALGVEQVSTTDNFFELGGHSLLAMRIVHEIQRQVGWRPDPRMLFFETLASIAAAKPDAVQTGGVA